MLEKLNTWQQESENKPSFYAVYKNKPNDSIFKFMTCNCKFMPRKHKERDPRCWTQRRFFLLTGKETDNTKRNGEA